jgi:hypothetical protein
MADIDLERERRRYAELVAALEANASEEEQLNLAVISATAVPFLLNLIDRLRAELAEERKTT